MGERCDLKLCARKTALFTSLGLAGIGYTFFGLSKKVSFLLNKNVTSTDVGVLLCFVSVGGTGTGSYKSNNDDWIFRILIVLTHRSDSITMEIGNPKYLNP